MLRGVKAMRFPNGGRFAFSILDDTDGATVSNIKPIYELLSDMGIYTTKSVWVLPPVKSSIQSYQGQTLSDPEYLHFILKLQEEGFEIGFHSPRGESSNRCDIIKSLEIFNELIGYYPKTYANHLYNKECLYWGDNRFDDPILRFIYRSAIFSKREKYFGHIQNSDYFWGDIAKKFITYIRNFVFSNINTLRVNPSMPYHDPLKPYVNFWFSSSDGHNVNAFNKLLREENQHRLEAEGGVCIVYTHFAHGFVENGEVNPVTRALLYKLSKKNGWFVPVSTLLDYIRSNKTSNMCPNSEKRNMEYMWFFPKVFRR